MPIARSTPAAPPAPAPRPLTRPPLSPWDVHRPLAADDARPAVRAWLAHLDAGRIGTATGPSEAQRARHARNEALLIGHRRGAIW